MVLDSLPPRPVSVETVEDLESSQRVVGTVIDLTLVRGDGATFVPAFGLALEGGTVAAIGFDPDPCAYVRVAIVDDAHDQDQAADEAEAAIRTWVRDRFGDYYAYEQQVLLASWRS